MVLSIYRAALEPQLHRNLYQPWKVLLVQRDLAELRARMMSVPEVHRISIMAARDPIPVTLRSLLRSRWPNAELVTADGWDVGLTQAMASEVDAPRSRFLILEWTLRDLRLPIDTSQAWQMSAVCDPIRFHGRQLSLILIEPRPNQNALDK